MFYGNTNFRRFGNTANDALRRDRGALPSASPGNKPVAFFCLPYDEDVEEYMDKMKRMLPEAESREIVLLAPYAVYAIPGCGDFDKESMRLFALNAVELCSEFWITDDRNEPHVLEEYSRAVSLGKAIRFYHLPEKEAKNHE